MFYLKNTCLYYSIGNGQPRKPALCQLYRHTIVPYREYGEPSRRVDWILNCMSLTCCSSFFVLNKAGVKRELLDTVKARKLAYYGHTMRKQGSCLEKEIMQGTMPGARRRGRPRTAWMDNIKLWTGLESGWLTGACIYPCPLSFWFSIRMTEDRDKWKKYVHGVANPRIEVG